MCGIVGAISTNKNVIPILLDGLYSLEYRGYDSAGVGYFKDKKIKIIKSKGKVNDLAKKINQEDNSLIGIAHTRWATHGKADSINAHPHRVKHITLVHNGIIENFEELQKMLSEKGYTFKSKTDTEVAAALLNYYYEQEKNIDLAIQKFIDNVIGSYAILFLLDNDLKTIYLLKKESPMIIGHSANTNFIASDMQAILKYTNNYYLVDDLEYVKVTAKDIKFYDKKGNSIQKDLKEYKLEDLNLGKGNYKHYMLKEIMEQQTTVYKTVEKYLENGLDSSLKLPDLTKYKEIAIVACGTAMHAGLVAKYLFQELTNTRCNVYYASEYRYQNNFLSKDTITIFISQSGETADTLAALKLVNEHNLDSLGIINVKESSIARNVQKVLYLETGKEVAVASTKAYTAQVALLALLALSHGLRNKTIKDSEALEVIKEFKDSNKYIAKVLENKKTYQQIAHEIYKEENIFYIGRTLDYCLSLEGSLKLKEISYLHSEAFPAGELKHGTISLIRKNTPVIASATDKKINAKTISNLKEVIARGARSYLITDDTSITDKDINIIRIPCVSPFLKAILIVIPYQLIAYYTADLLGNDIDKPKNLAKSVTVE